MPEAELGDLVLHYEDRGDPGARALLLIAGIPAIADDWSSLAEPLSASRRVIAYDNRGSGASSVTPGPYTMAQLAADGIGLLDALEIDRAAVCGFSLGGMVAQELALEAPERVERLILGCTHAGLAHAARQSRETERAFVANPDDWGARMRALAPLAFSERIDPEQLEHFIAKKSADVQDNEGYDAQIAAVLGHDTYQRLPRIACPTLVVTGDADKVIPGASSDVLAERIPGARLHVIEDAGHLFFLEQPAETLELFEAFLDDRPPRLRRER